MNRCAFPAPDLRSALFFVASLLVLTLAIGLFSSKLAAQTVQRQFPPAALRATLVVTQPPEVLLNRSPARLSPGARIRGTNNLLVLSGTLVGQELAVNYLLDPQGFVHQVWILTAEEAALKRPNMRESFGTMGDDKPPDLGNTPYKQLPRFGAQPAPLPAPTPNQ